MAEYLFTKFYYMSLNITTIVGGFDFLNNDYILMKSYYPDGYEIVSDTQCHFETDKGIIMLDTSCSIDGIFYTEIQLFADRIMKQYV